METINKIYYNYYTDPENPGRVVTLARVIDDKYQTQVIGYAVCRPTETKKLRMFTGAVQLFVEKGDKHNKKLGREIASGRLSKCPIFVQRFHESPLEDALEYLSNPDNFVKEKMPEFFLRTMQDAYETFLLNKMYRNNQAYVDYHQDVFTVSGEKKKTNSDHVPTVILQYTQKSGQ